jgi:hypothetical protein
MTSFTVSKPTETHQPIRNTYRYLSSTDNLLCVVDAGCVTIVLVSPKFGDSEHSFILSKNTSSFNPLFQSYNVTSRFHLLLGNFILWMRFQEGIFYDLHLDAVL